MIYIFILLLISLLSPNLESNPTVRYQELYNPELMAQYNPKKSKFKSLFYQAKYCDPIPLKTSLQTTFPNSLISINPDTHQLSIYNTYEQLRKIKWFLKSWDKPAKAITFEVQFIECNYVSENAYEQFLTNGFEQIPLTIMLSTKSLSGPDTIKSIVKSIEKFGEAQVLAAPLLTTLDHHQGHIKIGDQYPYMTNVTQENTVHTQINQFDTGIQLTLTPHLASPTTLNCQLSIDISHVKLWETIGKSRYPVISNRQITTTATLYHDTPLLIAGLIERRQHHNQKQLPIMAKLPLLGRLFRNHDNRTVKTDIMIIITPRIHPLKKPT